MGMAAAHHDHWTVGVVDTVLAHRTEKPVAELAMTALSEDEKTALLRRGEQRGSRGGVLNSQTGLDVRRQITVPGRDGRPRPWPLDIPADRRRPECRKTARAALPFTDADTDTNCVAHGWWSGSFTEPIVVRQLRGNTHQPALTNGYRVRSGPGAVFLASSA